MGDLAITGATSSIQTFCPVPLALSHVAVAQLLFLDGEGAESNGNTPGSTCCLLLVPQRVSRSTLQDVLHRYLHRIAGRSPEQDATHTLFPLGRHSSSSVLLLSRLSFRCFSLKKATLAWALALSLLQPAQSLSFQVDTDTRKQKRLPLVRRHVLVSPVSRSH